MTWRNSILKQILRLQMTQGWVRRVNDVLYETENFHWRETKRWYQIQELLWLLSPVLLDPSDYKRYGNLKDGGYVLYGDIADSFVLSIGIGDNTTFEEEISESVRAVLMVDHTVEVNPLSRGNVHFFPKKLVPYASDSNEIDLTSLVKLAENESRIILKIDIEGDEWAIFQQVPDEILMKLQQIVVEFHGLLRLCRSEIDSALDALNKINKYFQAVNWHGNNFSRHEYFLGIPIQDVIEVTFVSRQSYQLAKPRFLGLNFPNNPEAPEVVLGSPF